VYGTFTGADGTPVQQPILTTTALRPVADALDWESLAPGEVLGRFTTRFDRGPGGQGLPIALDPVEGSLPQAPAPAPVPGVDTARAETDRS
jgi:hypothetical protein